MFQAAERLKGMFVRARLALVLTVSMAVVLLSTASALAAPSARFASPAYPHVGVPATFDASGSAHSPGSSGLSYRWDFGDGSAPEFAANPQHAFLYPGTFDVVLVVTDVTGTNAAQSATVTHRVTVTQAPRTLLTGGSSGPGFTSFSFIGRSATSHFSCQLDAGDWAPCTSPATFNGLAAGAHVFSVRETTADGDVEPSPLSYPFVAVAASAPSLPVRLPPAGFPFPVPDLSVPTVRAPKTPSVRRPPTPSRRPPVRRVPNAHQGPKNVFTPADVVVGSRKNKRHGCKDRNPNHPENVSHCGWPRVTGMFFNTGETRCPGCPTSHNAAVTIIGTRKLNDLLLGGRGDVTIITYGGNNVLWADRVPGGHKSALAKRQKAKITAGNGNNIVYAGPGKNTIKVGKGRNIIHAWQGRGSVTCGSRKSVVRMMDRSRKRYKIRGCSTARGY